jgi:hypothetical protein
VPVRGQLLGSDPTLLAENAARLAELGSHGVDLNFGCPANVVNRHGGGSALLQEPELIHRIVAAVRRAVPADVPVMAGAYNLSVSSSGNNISYRVAGIFEDVIRFYQEQTTAEGWEQLGGVLDGTLRGVKQARSDSTKGSGGRHQGFLHYEASLLGCTF